MVEVVVVCDWVLVVGCVVWVVEDVVGAGGRETLVVLSPLLLLPQPAAARAATAAAANAAASRRLRRAPAFRSAVRIAPFMTFRRGPAAAVRSTGSR